MRTWSKRSRDNLRGVHSDLVNVAWQALQESPIDFTVIEGLRTIERQKQLVSQGFSRTMNSRHLTGHAIDIWPIDPRTGKLVSGRDDKRLWELFPVLAAAMKAAAADKNIPIEWGGDWKSFKDGPHFQLPHGKY